jgi:SAM-dependent methyltransferase
MLCGCDDARPVRTAADRLAAARAEIVPSPAPATSDADAETAVFTVVRCRRCGLAYLNPRPTAAEIGRYYPDDYHTARGAGGIVQRLEDAWRRRQFGEVAGWLANLRPRRGRLLDVGCGSGDLLAALRADGWRVSGVEPSARSAAIARAQRGLDVQTATFDDALLPDGAFEAVVFAAVLEHLHDPLRALARARRLLAPGGLVAVLFQPRFDAPQAHLFGPRWVGLDLPRHLYHFEPGTFAATARAAGLRVVAVERYSRRHSPAFWTASLAPGLQKQRLNLTARQAPRTRRGRPGLRAPALLLSRRRPRLVGRARHNLIRRPPGRDSGRIGGRRLVAAVIAGGRRLALRTVVDAHIGELDHRLAGVEGHLLRAAGRTRRPRRLGRELLAARQAGSGDRGAREVQRRAP